MASRHRGDFTRGYNSVYQGTNKTIKQLREIGEYVVVAAKAALKEGVDEIVQDAKHRAPRRTGKLQDAIKAVPLKAGAEYVIQANEPALNKKGIPYGQFVEFAKFHMWRGNKIEHDAHPFLYPAVEAGRANVKRKIEDAISNAINRGH